MWAASCCVRRRFMSFVGRFAVWVTISRFARNSSVMQSPHRISPISRVALSFALHGVGIFAGFGLSACHTPAKSSEHQEPSAPSAGVQRAFDRIEIGENGFAPSHVIVENAQPLVFRRTTDHSCATAVTFPQFHIEQPLPLNTDVSIVLPPTASGEVAFQCGVGENRGKVVANVAGG